MLPSLSAAVTVCHRPSPSRILCTPSSSQPVRCGADRLRADRKPRAPGASGARAGGRAGGGERRRREWQQRCLDGNGRTATSLCMTEGRS